MRSSRFDPIDDPSDPAWSGHVEVRGPRRRGVVVAALVLVGIALVGGVAWALLRGDGGAGAGAAPAAAPPGPSTDVSGEDVEQVVVPPIPSAQDPVETTPSNEFTGQDAEASPSGSGWAPLEATISAQDAGSGLIKGDTAGVAPVLVQRLDALAVELGQEIRVISGWRRRHEQEDLYRRFLNGTGNLAAVPGTSRHEVGYAADVYVGKVALANVPGVAEQAGAYGLHFPVPGEAWHVELIETASE